MFKTQSTTLFPDVSLLELLLEELQEQFDQVDPGSVASAVISEQLCDIADAIRAETHR
ncbi:hypothetical protein UFOVP29_63 [uncultured Caudovirales phage]|uniref:Uncharacterized protein n=1 Tax=uncultured Caudovirales phage TaxID=2100421 RepID=A0A6J5KPC3_9CAUD|nr:hypothetical protein UFOVP29_63 [uncultured Caudovirales phage]